MSISGFLLIVSIIIVLTTFLAIPNTLATTLQYNIDEEPNGLSYSDLAIQFWKWAYGYPINVPNPITDDTGEFIQNNQPMKESVYILPGGYGSFENRSITIPNNKSIFFPVLVYHVSYSGFPNLFTESDLTQKVKGLIDEATYVGVELDGEPIEYTRILSPFFKWHVPKDNMLYIPENDLTTITDGYWVYLKPLPAGNHTLHWKGLTPNYYTEAIYRINVTN